VGQGHSPGRKAGTEMYGCGAQTPAGDREFMGTLCCLQGPVVLPDMDCLGLLWVALAPRDGGHCGEDGDTASTFGRGRWL
jgi:hypothetical protein